MSSWADFLATLVGGLPFLLWGIWRPSSRVPGLGLLPGGRYRFEAKRPPLVNLGGVDCIAIAIVVVGVVVVVVVVV
jgi:hypothetical protein